ncbi:hypothetical protein ABZZ47_43270 [Streptomyces sp. NPDC006465]|uniref:hypothetical protein n=1 Tax=unclassified Streptomyces TaxID=2593676 RepID=UPI00332EFB70
MAPKTERDMFQRAVRQLRRVRTFYAMGILLWSASTLCTAWQSLGSRQMWVSALLLSVFTGLLLTATLSLRRLEPPRRGPAHHAAPRKATGPQNVHA